MIPDPVSGSPAPTPNQPGRRRSRVLPLWRTLFAVGIAAYVVAGWSVVRYGPRKHTVLHTRGGDVKLVGATPFMRAGSRRVQLYIDDREDVGDEQRAAEILDSVVPVHPADDLRSIGVVFVRFHGIWPLTFSTNSGYVFVRAPEGGWVRADRDQLHDHLAAFKP